MCNVNIKGLEHAKVVTKKQDTVRDFDTAK